MLRERVELLSDLADIEESINSYDWDSAICGMINVSTEYNVEEVVSEFWDDDAIDEYIRKEINDGADWTRIACFLANAENLINDYHMVDGYENLRDVTKSDVECAFNELKEMLEGSVCELIVEEFGEEEMTQGDIDELIKDMTNEDYFPNVSKQFITDEDGRQKVLIALPNSYSLEIFVVEE